MSKKYVILVIFGFFILYPVTSWLMMLWDVLLWGKRLLFEPSMPILYAEFGITLFAFIATLFLIFWFYMRALKGEK